MVNNSDPEESASDARVRLDQVLQSNTCIVYHDCIPDREFPHVKCSIYGAPKTNELFVRVENANVAFVGVTPSLLMYPAMSDRIFGLDVLDQEVAFGLAEELWERHKAELIRE